jgi:transposase
LCAWISAGYVINAVVVEGRSVKEVCEAHDISRSWLYELIARYRELGDEGLRPQSKRIHSSPTRVAAAIEDEIIALRKELTDLGVDAGPTRSTTTCNAVTGDGGGRCHRWRRSGGCCRGGASSPPNP